MKWFWFPIAVVATSLALVVAIVAIVAFPARAAVASALGVGMPWSGGSGHGGPWANGSGFTLPPELQGLSDVPADQRFGHFVGAEIKLKDKNNQPLTIVVTPGTIAAASATSLTVAANDGGTKTFTLNDQTIQHGQHAAGGSPANGSALAKGDAVVVVTLNQSTTATAVIGGGPRGFGGFGPGGPREQVGTGH